MEFNQYQKSDKEPFIIYVDLECLVEKTDGCKNNSENSSTTKLADNIPLGFWIITISTRKTTENKHSVYRGKKCMKKFCQSLWQHAMEITNFKKKKWSY